MKIYHRKQLKEELYFLGSIAILFVILTITGLPWFCPFHDFLGIPCPGCGFTTATKALIYGRFSIAYRFHPMVFAAPLFMVYYFYASHLRKEKPRSYPIVVGLFIFLFLAIYLMRWLNLLPGVNPLHFNPRAVLPSLFK